MAFTAGSPELAKAERLASQLSALYQTYGSSEMTGTTAAKIAEDYAQKLGFGITGLTTGRGFPPFGTILPSLQLGVAAALQNPRGETMANGIALGGVLGATVGIYMKRMVRTGEDYSTTMFSGVTLDKVTTVAGTTLSANGPFEARANDLLVFSDGTVLKVVGGVTSAASGSVSRISVVGSVGTAYAVGTAFDIKTVGVTRGTSGIAGATLEAFVSGSVLHGGYTAAVFFGGAAGSTGTVS